MSYANGWRMVWVIGAFIGAVSVAVPDPTNEPTKVEVNDARIRRDYVSIRKRELQQYDKKLAVLKARDAKAAEYRGKNAPSAVDRLEAQMNELRARLAMLEKSNLPNWPEVQADFEVKLHAARSGFEDLMLAE